MKAQAMRTFLAVSLVSAALGVAGTVATNQVATEVLPTAQEIQTPITPMPPDEPLFESCDDPAEEAGTVILNNHAGWR